MAASGSPSVLRVINDRAALEALVQQPVVSRSQLETLVGLSKPATAQLLTRLEQVGLVERAGLRDEGPGPRAQLWQLKADAAYTAGVDVTRSGIDVGIADLRGTIVAESFVHTSDALDRPADALLEALTTACGALGIDPAALAHISIGLPGAVDTVSGELRYASELPAWNGFDLRTFLDGRLDVPITVENDVNLVALNEMSQGVAHGVDDLVLLWMSERGLGSSVIVGGELVRGATRGAGEIGFALVPDLAQTGSIGPGRFGDLLSNAAIVALAESHGIEATGPIDALEQSLADPTSGFATDLARRVSGGLAAVVSILDPELIVIDGDIGVAGGEPFCRLVSEALALIVEPRVPLVPGRADVSSVRAGAVQAALVPARERSFAAGSVLEH